MSETMKAVEVQDGGPLHLADMARPEPAPNEILVKTAFSGLNRADLVQRAGAYPPPPGASPILGLEVSGTVEAVVGRSLEAEEAAWLETWRSRFGRRRPR